VDRYSLRLTAFVFLYVLLVGIVVQTIVLPLLVPSWHAGDGLLKGHDWVSYHRIAVALAQKIRSEGWKVWELRPHGYGWIEPGVTAAIYAVTVAKPWILLPFNALIHALSAFCLYQIFFCITGKRGLLTATATLPFVFFPSSLLWTVQIHKDGAAILGLLLCLWGWAFLLPGPGRKLSALRGCLLIIVGLFITFVVRAYWGELLLMLSKYGIVLFGVWQLLKSGKLSKEKFKALLRHWSLPAIAIFFFIPLSLGDISLSLGSVAFKMPRLSKDGEQMGLPTPSQESVSRQEKTETTGSVLVPSGLLQRPADPKFWELSPWLPYSIDAKLAQIARVRRGFNADMNARSKIDTYTEFGSATEFILYFPRALQIAFFAPFPNQWFAKGFSEFSGGLRKLVGFEMLVFWCLLPFSVFFLLKYRRNPFLWVCFVVCFSFTILFVYAVPTMGTVHRFRYIFYMIFAGFGVLGIKERWEGQSLVTEAVT
jgi:hypothetical protein